MLRSKAACSVLNCTWFVVEDMSEMQSTKNVTLAIYLFSIIVYLSNLLY